MNLWETSNALTRGGAGGLHSCEHSQIEPSTVVITIRCLCDVSSHRMTSNMAPLAALRASWHRIGLRCSRKKRQPKRGRNPHGSGSTSRFSGRVTMLTGFLFVFHNLIKASQFLVCYPFRLLVDVPSILVTRSDRQINRQTDNWSVVYSMELPQN